MKKKPVLLAVSLLSILVVLTVVVYHIRSTSQQLGPKQMKTPTGRDMAIHEGSKSTPSSKSNTELSHEEPEQLGEEVIEPKEEENVKIGEKEADLEPEVQTPGGMEEGSDIEVKRQRLEELRLSFAQNWRLVTEMIDASNALSEEHQRLEEQESALIDEMKRFKDDEERWRALKAEEEALAKRRREKWDEIKRMDYQINPEQKRRMQELVSKLKEIKREMVLLEEQMKSEDR